MSSPPRWACLGGSDLEAGSSKDCVSVPYYLTSISRSCSHPMATKVSGSTLQDLTCHLPISVDLSHTLNAVVTVVPLYCCSHLVFGDSPMASWSLCQSTRLSETCQNSVTWVATPCFYPDFQSLLWHEPIGPRDCFPSARQSLVYSFSWNGPYQSLLNLSVCGCFQAQSGLLPPATSSSFSGDRNSLSHHRSPCWHVCGDRGSQLRLLHQIPQWWTGGTSAVNTNFSPSWTLEVQDQGSWLIAMSSHNLSLVCTEGGDDG